MALVEFSSLCEITISSSFTAECAESAEASENPSVDWNVLKLCALGDLRGDKSQTGFLDGAYKYKKSTYFCLASSAELFRAKA